VVSPCTATSTRDDERHPWRWVNATAVPTARTPTLGWAATLHLSTNPRGYACREAELGTDLLWGFLRCDRGSRAAVAVSMRRRWCVNTAPEKG